MSRSRYNLAELSSPFAKLQLSKARAELKRHRAAATRAARNGPTTDHDGDTGLAGMTTDKSRTL
jgi:hypothetical protein